MPKFKQKNRKKRKYIKRSSPISELSLSRSWFIKLMPYIIMVVGFLTTLAINPPTLQPISMQPLQPIQPIQPIDISLTKPSISFDGILQIFQELSTLISGIQAYAQLLAKELLVLLASLLMQTGTILGKLFAAIVQLITVIASSIVFVATTIGKGIIIIVQAVFQTLTVIALTIWHFLIEVAKAVIATSEIISKAILDALTIAAIKTIEWLNAVWYFLMTPFRALAAYYIKLKPYIDYVLNNFKDSTLFLKESMSLVMGGLTR